MKKLFVAGLILMAGLVGSLVNSQGQGQFTVKLDRGTNTSSCCLDSAEDSEIEPGFNSEL